jgi:hypothetical protein
VAAAAGGGAAAAAAAAVVAAAATFFCHMLLCVICQCSSTQFSKSSLVPCSDICVTACCFPAVPASMVVYKQLVNWHLYYWLLNFNPLPLLFKYLLPGQDYCVFFSGHLNFHTAPESGLPSREKNHNN